MPSDKREQHEKEVKQEAQKILDKFAKALGEIKEVPESYVEREEDRRQEKEGERSSQRALLLKSFMKKNV